MAQTFGSGSDEDVISAINVTPLVDVVLVLLIIFLITAPVLYQSAIRVQLPKAKTGEQAQKTPLTFTLSKDGNLSWNNEILTWNEFNKRLRNHPPSSEEQVVISADEATAHGTVIRLMDSLREVGLTRFALNVESGRK